MAEDTTPPPAKPSWWQNEDWLAVIAAVPLIAAVLSGWSPSIPKLGWTTSADFSKVFTASNFSAVASVGLVFILVSAIVLAASLGKKVLPFIGGAAVVFALAMVAQFLSGQSTVKAWGLEYVIFALALGLLWSHLLPTPAWLMTAVRTEFFIKVGIVMLGASILFQEMLKAGLPGLIQAAFVIPVVWHITFRLCRWLKVDDEFGVMLSTSVSICGVSAAIAACGAIQGDRKKLSYVTSIVLLCAVPMMVLMPPLIKTMGLNDAVGGAWLGGTLDTSGSVAAATEMISEAATKTGTIVKLSQNVLIGFAAFFISIWWTMRGGKDGTQTERPSVGVIWERFPKFVLGFIAASLAFSFAMSPEEAKAANGFLKGLRELWFTAAFVCIGLETRLGDLFKLGGGRPALAFLGGQAFNIVWTLLLAWLLFGGVLMGE
ncbi:Uncharacterized membrane protein YadS [Prosthecobacter debontii]|uniref:Uncharacterized membrane protein YadS n=1 Tax=Prosthecobacter debontii TaxID=48467 RepID=A0A1T4X9L2_9BACT|nr:putative sulfate exporter family transporter [Prosthecobacter debontii]SKA86263.1 Uncharacterized membrane protein YadS [Prosthecobacter debontii]